MIADLYHGSYDGDPDPSEPGCPHDMCDRLRVDGADGRLVLICIHCGETLVEPVRPIRGGPAKVRR